MIRVFLMLWCLVAVGVHASPREAAYAMVAPVIDGLPYDAAWKGGSWYAIDQLLIGASMPAQDDFNARYKVVWDERYLYVLAEITDDVLYDGRPDPLVDYWEDDTLEVLLDEDLSGGPHEFDYNAFAYHVSLANQVVDIAPFDDAATRDSKEPNVREYPDHVQSAWRRDPANQRVYWELRVAVYGDDYTDQGIHEPRLLHSGKQMGFMVAYCDSDGGSREHFLADTAVAPVAGDRNLAYRDASVFGRLVLVPPER